MAQPRRAHNKKKKKNDTAPQLIQHHPTKVPTPYVERRRVGQRRLGGGTGRSRDKDGRNRQNHELHLFFFFRRRCGRKKKKEHDLFNLGKPTSQPRHPRTTVLLSSTNLHTSLRHQEETRVSCQLLPPFSFPFFSKPMRSPRESLPRFRHSRGQQPRRQPAARLPQRAHAGRLQR